MTLRARLIHDMHRTGCRLDDAAACADVALRLLREQRDAVIVQARNSGLSLREIARLFSLSHVRVLRVVTQADGGLTAVAATVPARQAGECRGEVAEQPRHGGADSSAVRARGNGRP